MKSLRLILVAALVLALAACSSSGGKYFQFRYETKVGTVLPADQRKPAENFSGTLLSGGKTSLAASKGKVVLVNFWAAWCAPCQVETPQLDLLYRSVHRKGIDFLGIDTKDVKTNAKYFVSRNHISYPIVEDQEGETALRLGNISANLPYTVLVDKHGRVAAVYLGQLTDKDLRPPLAKLAAEK